MRVAGRVLLAALAALLLLAAAAPATASQAQAEVAALAELEDWLVAHDTAAALAAPKAEAKAEPAKAKGKLASLKKTIVQVAPHAGTVQMGGFVPPSDTPDMSQGAADGSVLPPYDPFGLADRHEKREAWRQKRRREQVDKVNAAERARYLEQLEKRRAHQLRREKEEEAREAAAEKAALEAKAGLDGQAYETDLIEQQADASDEHAAMLEQQADAAEAAADRAEAEADALLQAQVQAQIEADIESQLDAESETEAEADADADAEAEGESESEAESSNAADADVPEVLSAEPLPDAYHALMEVDATGAPLLPSLHVTYGNEAFSEQEIDNADSRAVFARRARAQQVVRFEKAITSDGGVAVVNGVTKLPCGKEMTDTGLSAAVVSANPGPTVTAVDPQAPVLHDDNIVAVKKLPVAPQYHAEKTADEYGDMPAE